MSTIKHSKYTDFAISQLAEKQSFMAFRKAHNISFIWHYGCIVTITTFLLRAFIFFERSKETKQKKIAG